MDAFDADVLIYATAPDHPAGRRVRGLFSAGAADATVGIGSMLLLPELLAKPTRDGADQELRALTVLLARLDLRPVDESTAALGVVLAARYRLRPAEAVHLATAVAGGADRFITNNRKDFRRTITEIDITYPADLPEIL